LKEEEKWKKASSLEYCSGQWMGGLGSTGRHLYMISTATPVSIETGGEEHRQGLVTGSYLSFYFETWNNDMVLMT
jgi:hypothetical protein